MSVQSNVSNQTLEIWVLSLCVINEGVSTHCIEGLGFLKTVSILV